MQFLSEPSGGSDLAGCLTRADRDGDVFIMNGSKIWSSAACREPTTRCASPARTGTCRSTGASRCSSSRSTSPASRWSRSARSTARWSSARSSSTTCAVPAARRRRRGRRRLDRRQPPAGARAQRRRRRIASTRAVGRAGTTPVARTTGSSRSPGRAAAPATPSRRQLVAEAHVRQLVHGQLIRRITAGHARPAQMAPPAGSLMKLFSGTNVMRRDEIGLELSGHEAVVWPEGGGDDRTSPRRRSR